MYLKCTEHFNLKPSECIIFEDALYAAETAKNAGFSLVVMDENCHSQEDKKALKDISDRYIYSFNELIKEFEVE